MRQNTASYSPGLFSIFAGALFFGILSAAAASEVVNAPIVTLPASTGPFDIGTGVWHWTGKRGAVEDEDSWAPPLEVMAQLWYPAQAQDTPAATRYRPLGGPEFAAVKQHAVGAARFASLDGKAPVIVICPGRGTNRYYYTSIAEDLASRGFAVFAVDIPEIGYVEFPDGRTVEPSDRFRPSFELITGPYEEVDKFFEPAVAIGLAHLRLALTRLGELDADDPAGNLTGQLDLDTVGAFGHSLGGRICGAFADVDDRIIALAAMEGVPPRSARKMGLSAASLMLYSSELPEDMALPNIRELYDNRKSEATILRLEGFGHNSVTDRPLIFRDSYDYDVAPLRAIDITRAILASFFQAHLADREFAPHKLAEAPEVTIIETTIGPSD